MLERLTRAIEAEADLTRRACLEARRALTHARLEQRDLARDEVLRLRAAWMGHESAELSAWLCLTEGVLVLLDAADGAADRTRAAADRLRRAQALAAGAPDSEVGPLALAWLADLELAAGQLLRALPLAQQGVALVHPPDHEALCRLALVVADAWMQADDPKTASDWYARARRQAGRAQDRLAQGEALHRMAVQRVDAVCRTGMSPASEPGQSFAALAAAMLDSADHYALMGVAQGLDHLRAQRDHARQRLRDWQSRYDDGLSLAVTVPFHDPASLQAALVQHGLDIDSWKHLYDS